MLSPWWKLYANETTMIRNVVKIANLALARVRF